MCSVSAWLLLCYLVLILNICLLLCVLYWKSTQACANTCCKETVTYMRTNKHYVIHILICWLHLYQLVCVCVCVRFIFKIHIRKQYVCVVCIYIYLHLYIIVCSELENKIIKINVREVIYPIGIWETLSIEWLKIILWVLIQALWLSLPAVEISYFSAYEIH